jgi:hypothetical protein
MEDFDYAEEQDISFPGTHNEVRSDEAKRSDASRSSPTICGDASENRTPDQTGFKITLLRESGDETSDDCDRTDE